MTETPNPPRLGALTAARAQHAYLEVTMPRKPMLADRPREKLVEFAWNYAPSFFLDVGTACPLHCTYCSVDRGADDKDVRMEAREHLYMRMADGAGSGVLKVTLIGGEPASRPDFLHLADVAHAMAFDDVILATKSVKLARPEFVAELVEHNVSMVHLSLDSFDPEVLAKLLGSKSAPKLLLAGLHELLKVEIELFLFAVLTQQTLPGLQDYVRQMAALQAQYGRPMTAVLTPLKVESRAKKNFATLVPRMKDVADAVADALDLAEEMGVTLAYKNIPSCLLPRHGDFALERYLVESRIDLETEDRLPAAPSPYLTHGDVCAACAMRATCPGVDREYAATFGWAEFAAV